MGEKERAFHGSVTIKLKLLNVSRDQISADKQEELGLHLAIKDALSQAFHSKMPSEETSPYPEWKKHFDKTNMTTDITPVPYPVGPDGKAVRTGTPEMIVDVVIQPPLNMPADKLVEDYERIDRSYMQTEIASSIKTNCKQIGGSAEVVVYQIHRTVVL